MRSVLRLKQQDDLHRKGPSKENRTDPIMGMGENSVAKAGFVWFWMNADCIRQPGAHKKNDGFQLCKGHRF